MATKTTPPVERVGLPIKRFPAPLKARIAAVATADGVNFNDVAVGALAGHFGVPYEPLGRKSAGIGDSDYINLTMPRTLRKKINQTAADRETSARSVTLAVLEATVP